MLVHCSITNQHLIHWYPFIYPHGWKEAVKVKCIAQEHNIMSTARAWTKTTCSRDESTNHEATMRYGKTIYTNLWNWGVYGKEKVNQARSQKCHFWHLFLRKLTPTYIAYKDRDKNPEYTDPSPSKTKSVRFSPITNMLRSFPKTYQPNHWHKPTIHVLTLI